VDKGMIPEGDYVRIEYAPSGCAALHEGSAEAIAEDGSTLTLAETPTTGELDTHPHAYAGARLRILEASVNNYVQERTIASYDHETRVATFDTPLAPIPTVAEAEEGEDGHEAETTTYEICPVTTQVMDQAIWLRAALDVLAIEDQPKRYGLVQGRLRETMRELRLFYAQRDQANAGKVESDRFSGR